MIASIFREFIAKYLRPTTAKIYELINGKPEGSQQKLLHKVMLTEEQTAKDSWDSLSISRSVVSADVVAMDSTVPLKIRGSFEKATGEDPQASDGLPQEGERHQGHSSGDCHWWQ